MCTYVEEGKSKLELRTYPAFILFFYSIIDRKEAVIYPVRDIEAAPTTTLSWLYVTSEPSPEHRLLLNSPGTT